MTLLVKTVRDFLPTLNPIKIPITEEINFGLTIFILFCFLITYFHLPHDLPNCGESSPAFDMQPSLGFSFHFLLSFPLYPALLADGQCLLMTTCRDFALLFSSDDPRLDFPF